ncbi:hypothetical protein MITS9504_02286 [Synechococcus sp. MIT S9504]|nr:hypothetical protein MITS9504_02286 [Synechococcus sp. MIT S9504]
MAGVDLLLLQKLILARQQLQGMAKLFFDWHLLGQAMTQQLSPMGNRSFQVGSSHLPLLLRSSLMTQQLEHVEPGLKEVL